MPSAGAPIDSDFHLLAEALPQIVWLQRRDGLIEFVNRRGISYAGLSPENLVSRSLIARVLDPADRRRVRDIWRDARSREAGYSLEARLRRSDGIHHWHRIQAHPIRDERGSLVRWMGMATDVHDVKMSDERSAFLLALSTELAGIADPHDLVCTAMGRLRERLRASRATLAELDHSEGEAILLTQREDDPARIEVSTLPLASFSLFALQSPESVTTVVRDTRRDARSAHLHAREFEPRAIGAFISVPLLRGGQPVALFSIVATEPRDWSAAEVELAERVADIVWPAFEKARADRDLAASEERLRLAQAVARVGAWEWDPATDECILSPECKELLGVDPAGTHRLRELLRHVEPQDIPAVQSALDACQRTGSEEFEYRYVHPARGQRWIHSKVGTVPYGEGARVFGIHLDVTERRLAEQALQDINQRKDEFLAMLAHELRNPLAPIRNAAQILRLHGKGNTNLEWARSVIERQSRHLTRLVDDLLDVSRIVRGQISLEKERIDLSDVVRHALETSRPLVRERKHQLTVTLAGEPLPLDADLTRLSQVIANLVINAAKYTPESGHIWLEAHRVDHEVVLRVRDTGMGISSNLLPHIFELFTQGARTLDRAQGGLGIGLTLVKRIVDMHGGHVEARSAGEGEGSEFIVRLPLLAARAAAGTEPQPSSATTDRGSKVRVLVVDDNVDAAESIAMLLSLEGYEVRSVHAAADALETAQTFQPHLVLLDIGLPGMDGYEVARRLRAQQRIESMRVVAITGYGQQSDRERAREAGFDEHLV
ncbi:MAG TPA: ATP-binding protein, partial [Steroidobacteraceae bacterium]|nr:ATP-binding protein [Steroidobacteraceae bacterium]